MTEKKLTKKEIVSFFLDNGIFLNPKILEKITPENYLEIYESYKSTEKETKNKINTSLQNLDESNVNVLFSYQEDPKKRKYEDFVSLFILFLKPFEYSFIKCKTLCRISGCEVLHFP